MINKRILLAAMAAIGLDAWVASLMGHRTARLFGVVGPSAFIYSLYAQFAIRVCRTIRLTNVSCRTAKLLRVACVKVGHAPTRGPKLAWLAGVEGPAQVLYKI